MACAFCAGVLVLSAILVSSGCRGSGTPAASSPAPAPPPAQAAVPADISGTYTLVAVNDGPLPYTMTHEPPGVRVTAGSFRIDADGTCSSRMEFVVPSGEAMTREVKARWTRDGATLNMTWEGAGTNTGTLTGDTFVMENEGQRFIYRKAQ
jgi:hypothetical protein